jgi:hypothetical protein
MLQDADDKLAALVISHMTQTIPYFWSYFCARIEALYNKEIRYDWSKRCGYDFVAIHYHWYNRYAEMVSQNGFKLGCLLTKQSGEKCTDRGPS